MPEDLRRPVEDNADLSNKEAEKFLEAIQHPIRRRVIHFLKSKQKMTSKKILEHLQKEVPNLSNTTLANHIAFLKNCEVLIVHGEGTVNQYSLDKQKVQKFVEYIDNSFGGIPLLR